MDYKTAQAILVLFVEEQKLKAVVLKHFQFSPLNSDRIRKGDVSVPISEELELVLNPTFYKRLKKVMKSLGSRPVRVEGRNYWSNLVKRSDIGKGNETGEPK